MTDIASTPEPPPSGGYGPSIHDLVIADIEQRKAFGLAKYGTILQVGDGRRSLVDAYQEALGLAVYLRQELAKQGLSAIAWPRRLFDTTFRLACIVLAALGVAHVLAGGVP